MASYSGAVPLYVYWGGGGGGGWRDSMVILPYLVNGGYVYS